MASMTLIRIATYAHARHYRKMWTLIPTEGSAMSVAGARLRDGTYGGDVLTDVVVK